MTNKFYSAVLAATTVLAVSLGATGANAATASGTATAKIIEPIQISQTAQLNFGVIVPSATADTVTISTAGAKTCGTNISCVSGGAAGGFHATGTTGQAVTISVVASTSLSNGTQTMNVTGLTASAATGTLAGTGFLDFTVGGVLNVGVNQAAGTYNGNYNVTVNYS